MKSELKFLRSDLFVLIASRRRHLLTPSSPLCVNFVSKSVRGAYACSFSPSFVKTLHKPTADVTVTTSLFFFPLSLSQLFIWRAQLHSQLFRGFHSSLWQRVLTAGYSTESNLLYFRQLLLLYCANLHHQNSSVPSEEMSGKRRWHERLTIISMQVTVCSAFFC